VKKIIFILGPLLVLAAVVGGLAFAGILDIPGITPPTVFKRIEPSKDLSGGLAWGLTEPLGKISKQMDAVAKAAEKTEASKPAPPPTDPVDPSLGDTKLATLWNDLEVDQLQKITAKWQPAALAKVLAKMDGDQVTKYLNALDPARADVICRALQTFASKLPKQS
jgi:hypothetical protein